MISPDEIAAARAVPMPWLVSRDLLLKKIGRLRMGRCIFHQDGTPSLAIYSDHFHCFGCGAHGDPIEWVRRTRRLDFETAVRELASGRQPKGTWTRPTAAMRDPTIRGVVSHRGASRETEVPPLVLEEWRTAIAPTLASFYLESRGVAQKALPEALRGHAAIWCVEKRAYRPAMLAAVCDAQGRLTARQCTWIETKLVYDGQSKFAKGARALDLSAGKKTLGPMGAGAVKLAAAGEILGLSEGVESALAAAKLFRLPVWATCGGARLGCVELPDVVRHVVIFGDRGKKGERLAAKAERAYRQRGYGCQIEYPDPAFGDFAEQVLA